MTRRTTSGGVRATLRSGATTSPLLSRPTRGSVHSLVAGPPAASVAFLLFAVAAVAYVGAPGIRPAVITGLLGVLALGPATASVVDWWAATEGEPHRPRALLPRWVGGVEWSTGALFAICGARFGVSWDLWPALAFAAGGVVVGAIDIRWRRIPTVVVGHTAAVCSGFIALGALALDRPSAVLASVAGAATAGGLLLVLHLVSPAGLGMGDVRFAALVGLVAGWAGWSAGDAVAGPIGSALAAVFVATVVALATHAVAAYRRRQAGTLPLAPALTVGTLIVVWSAA